MVTDMNTGHCHRSPRRRPWTQAVDAGRRARFRLQPHDDVAVHKVLPVHPRPRRSFRHRQWLGVSGHLHLCELGPNSPYDRFYPAIISTQTHFLRLGGTASSIAYVGASLGGIVFPIMYQNLFPQVGFGWTVRIVGFVCLACCLVTWACCTSRLPPREPGPLFDLSAFRDVKFMTFTAGACIASLGMSPATLYPSRDVDGGHVGLFVPFFFAAQFAEEVLHSTPSVAFDVIAVMNAGSVVGRPIPGLLADLLGCYNLAVPSLLVAGLLVLAVWLTSHSLAALMCFAAFYGMFSGIFIALNPPCLVRISRLEDIGSRMGLLFAITSFWYARLSPGTFVC
jgi:hypothetical protein